MSENVEMIEKHIFDKVLKQYDELHEKIYQKVVELNKIGHHEITSEDVCIFLNDMIKSEDEE